MTVTEERAMPAPSGVPALRVAVLAPPWFRVPPDRYGGIESVVALLTEGLVAAGHDVTLFATGDSTTSAQLASAFARPQSAHIGEWLPELRQAFACLRRAQDFDVVSDHTGPLAVTLAASLGVPLLHTVHGPLDGQLGVVYAEACALAPAAALASISLQQRLPRPALPWAANCPNAVDLDAYPFSAERGSNLVFVGRLCPEKGAHRAIAVAQALGLPLTLAGKCREPHEIDYFATHVRPHLDGSIEYVGEVTHAEKVELLQSARAVLFPIDWDEPFGLVMIEAMACGAPVVASRRGAVPEVIEDGVSGVIVDDWDAWPAAVEAASAIDPARQRRSVEERFSPARMVGDYERALAAVATRVSNRA